MLEWPVRFFILRLSAACLLTLTEYLSVDADQTFSVLYQVYCTMHTRSGYIVSNVPMYHTNIEKVVLNTIEN